MKIFQLEISKYRYADFLKEITEFLMQPSSDISPKWVKSQSKKWKAIFTPNPEICLKTLEDEEFLEVLNTADYLTSDGIGLYLAYQITDSNLSKILNFCMLPIYIWNILFRKRYLYQKYGERICGSDITNSLVLFAQQNNIKVAIIDPHYPQDLEKCASQETFIERLSEKFSNLDFNLYVYSEENSNEIFRKIHTSGAQILFSTLGMKRQELSVLRWLELCPHIKLWLGIGSAFDYHTGFQKRAPKIFRTLWFEWLYRIFTSPNKFQRLVRIYQAIIVFPLKVLLYKK